MYMLDFGQMSKLVMTALYYGQRPLLKVMTVLICRLLAEKLHHSR